MSEWIKCSERLPEVGRFVLAVYSDGVGYGSILVASYIDRWRAYGFESNDWIPTHWMPLPKPPK